MKKLESLFSGMIVKTFKKYGNCCIVGHGNIIHISEWYTKKENYGILGFSNFSAISYKGDLYLISLDDCKIFEQLGADEAIQILSV